MAKNLAKEQHSNTLALHVWLYSFG